MITIRLLGSVEIRDDTGSELETLLRQPKRVALLSYLAAAEPRGFHRRSTLLGLFWPESTQNQARHALSQALHVLRQEMGEGTIITRGESEVALGEAAVAVDIWALETALETGDHESVVSLHRGPFLNGLAINASVEFDQWLDTARDRLSRAYADSLERLAEAASKRGERHKAVEWWRRLEQHDPYSTLVTVGLMRALEASGDRAGALLQADHHTAALHNDLAADPSPDVVAYADRLRREPVRRMDDLALGTPRVGVEQNTDRPLSDFGERTHRRGFWASASALATVLAVTAAVFLPHWGDRGPQLEPGRVVVIPFENRTGDSTLNELGVMAADWVGQAIQQVEGLDVVPAAYAQQSNENTDNEEAGDAVRAVAERTNAGLVISGTIYDVGDSLQFRVEIVDINNGRRLQTVDEAWAGDSWREAISNLEQRVSGALAFALDPYMAEGKRPLPSPPKLDAYREHRLGYEAFDRGAYAEALEHHTTAYALDTTLVRAVVAGGYAARTYAQRASLARFADERRHLLSRSGQLDLDILLAELEGDKDAALRAAREMGRLDPEGFGAYGHANFALRANRPNEALSAIAEYDPYVPWHTGWAQYWSVIAAAYHMLGDHERELVEALRGREQHPDRLHMLNCEVRALGALGRVGQIVARLDEVLAMPTAGGVSFWTPFFTAGAELRAHGHPEAANEVFERVVDLLHERPPREGRRYALARALYLAERWEEARVLFEELATEIPESEWPLDYVGYLGVVSARVRDSTNASQMADRLREMHQPHLSGQNILWQARIAALLGQPDHAMLLLMEALHQGVGYGVWLHRDIDLESLRERTDFREALRPKG